MVGHSTLLMSVGRQKRNSRATDVCNLCFGYVSKRYRIIFTLLFYKDTVARIVDFPPTFAVQQNVTDTQAIGDLFPQR